MVNTKKLFTVSFAIIVIIRALTLHEIKNYIPYTELYIAYMVFWGLMILSKGKCRILTLRSNGMKVIVMLTLYYIVWGLTTTRAALDDAFEVMYKSLLLMVFIAVSCFWIRKLNCLEEIIRATYVALSILMWVLFFFYFRQINLLETMGSYWVNAEWLRTRTKFGFLNNIAAEYSLSVILLSLYVLKKNLSHKKKVLIWLNDLVMLIIILASNSRGTTIAFIFITIVCFCISRIKKGHIKSIIKIGAALILTVAAILIYQIAVGKLDITELLTISNRGHFLDNLKILEASGRWLFGIGNISGGFYSGHHQLEGLTTNYMEVSYVSFFVGSGVVGCAWLLCVLFLLLNGILNGIKTSNEALGRWLLLVLIYMLFLSLFETYIFSFMYITSNIFLLLIISYSNITYSEVQRRNIYVERKNKAKYLSAPHISVSQKNSG